MPDKSEFFDETISQPIDIVAKPVETTPEILRYKAPPHLKRYAYIAAGVAALIVVIGVVGRVFAAREVEDWTQAQAVPVVRTVAPLDAKGGHTLVLPGAVQAYNAAPIYGQVSGTIQKWYVDIGAPVKQGQLLAQIDPRTYQAALSQSQGQLARDTAQLTNAKTDLGRYKMLAQQNAISSQQLATQQSTVDADTGVVQADRAAVQQAAINLGYTRIVAPFDGIVTSRSVDIGSFVAVGNASATPLFTVADQSRVRIYVRVPQSYSAGVRPGTTAKFTVPEYPGRTFTGTVEASAGAVDAASGTVLVQLQSDNKDQALKPGEYAQVEFGISGANVAVQVPSSALMFRDTGMVVATVGPGNRVAIKQVVIGHDYGTTVEIASGLSPRDRVIDSPPDSLNAGDFVRIASNGAKKRRG